MPDKTVQDALAPSTRLRPRSLSFFLVAALAVGPLWLIVPSSWAFLAYNLASGALWGKRGWSLAWVIFALVEVLFSVYYHYLAKIISGPSPLKYSDVTVQQAAFLRFIKAGLAKLPLDGFDEESLDASRTGSPTEEPRPLDPDDPRAVEFRDAFSTWFGKVPFSSIRVHHIHTWLYAFLYNEPLSHQEEIPADRLIVLNATVRLLEERTGTSIPAGTDNTVKPMCLMMDKVNIVHRPFILYAFIRAGGVVSQKYLEYSWGARFLTYQGLDFMIRVPESWNPVIGTRPTVFLHGLGLGLLQYVLFIQTLLCNFPDRPLLVLLQPHISQNIFHPRHLKPSTIEETTQSLANYFTHLGWVEEAPDMVSLEQEGTDAKVPKGVTLLSHSNGSYVHAWMLKHHPHMMARSCFVDPVTFCSCEGDVCYNFVYRPCATGLELAMRYFVGSEVGIANLIQRHFDWAANTLWYDEIPNARDERKTKIILGGKDDIVHPERVKRYLSSHGIRDGIFFDPTARHGQVLVIGSPSHAEVMRWLNIKDY